MIKLTLKQYKSIHRDYRCTWTNPESPELIGKKTAFECSLQHAAGVEVTSGGTCTMIIEGQDFEII